MPAALRILWRALVHFYDESLLLIRANVIWFIGSIPLFLLVMAAAWVFVPPVGPESPPVVWPLMLAGFVLLAVPSPFAVGVYALARDIVRGETPEFGLFWVAVRRWWRRGLAMFGIGGMVLVALTFNTAFYLQATQGWLQAISLLWLYAILYWMTLQTYLIPLLLTSEADGDDGGPSVVPLPALYRRAAILALANPVFSLVLLLGTVVVMVLSAIAVPIYLLVGMGYVALVGARGLLHLRRKYLPEEAAEDVGGAAE